MKACASLPRGDVLYRLGQKKFGNVNGNPLAKIQYHIELVRRLLKAGFLIEDHDFMEVGTGHIPILPICFVLSGARSVVTVDLHRKLDFGLLRETLRYFKEKRSDIESMYAGTVRQSVLDEGFALIDKLGHVPRDFLEEGRIRYLAPADATESGLPAASVDYHFSYTVLEHIPHEVLKRLFQETVRVLRRRGIAIHSVDPSDHFQQMDTSIPKINFLRYTDKEWHRIAGNQFSYHNRLRLSDYRVLFEEFFEILDMETDIDEDCVRVLKSGFPLAERFKPYSFEDLCCTSLHATLRPKHVESSR
ncbi:MAG TPA: class I SAM-dependent methyltransferase [Pyrinomonadaceae bacterium]|nr:class I SAM-dependent methyltransferase [Pyrinomonadaceae bacterium]